MVEPKGGEHNEPVLPEEGTRGPGQTLHEERERRGLTINQVATELRLAQRQIEALEADDYSTLPPAPFVRGYLRGYARLLDLDGEALVDLFNADQRESIELSPAGAAATSGEHRPHTARIALAILILGIVVALGWWVWTERSDWFGDGGVDGSAEPAEESAEATESDSGTSGANGSVRIVTPDTFGIPAQESSSGNTPKPIVLQPELLFPRINDDATSVAERDAEVEAAFEQIPVDDFETSDEVLAGSGDAAEADDEDGDSTEDTAGEAAPDTAEEPAAESPADDAAGGAETTTDGAEQDDGSDETVADAPTEGPNSVTLEIDADSWVEVYDDRERRLAYGLYGSDDTLQLRGWEPFEIFLGNARAVAIELDGETVEFDGFVRSNDTARVLIGAEGVRTP